MAVRQIPVFNGVVNCDPSSSANSLAQRDGSGNLAMAQAQITSLLNSGGVAVGARNVTANTSLDNTACFVSVNATSGAIALTLPSAAASAGFFYIACKTDSSGNHVTLGNGADNIQSPGAATATTYTITAQATPVIVWCDGSQWYAGKLG